MNASLLGRNRALTQRALMETRDASVCGRWSR